MRSPSTQNMRNDMNGSTLVTNVMGARDFEQAQRLAGQGGLGCRIDVWIAAVCVSPTWSGWVPYVINCSFRPFFPSVHSAARMSFTSQRKVCHVGDLVASSLRASCDAGFGRSELSEPVETCGAERPFPHKPADSSWL